MFKLRCSFNVISFGKITTAVVQKVVKSIISKTCTRWWFLAIVGGFIFAVQHILPLAFFMVL